MKKISELEKAEFCEQMAMVLDGGITVEDGIDAIVSQIEIKSLIREFEKITKEYESSVNINVSTITIHPDLFNRMLILKNSI